MEFHPVILLMTIHKITTIMANFMGINSPIQSMIPSLSTCNSRSSQDTGSPVVCLQEINGGFPPKLREAIPRARPVRLTPTTEIPNYWESSIGVWEFQEDQRAPGAPNYPQVIHILLWITLVEFRSFSSLVV